MRLTSKPLNITQDNPFAEDVLSRKHAAETITNLLQNTAGEHYVIGLNAAWGQGKTTFLRMLQQHLSNSDINCLLVNAWKNDFSQQAMLTLLSDFNEAIESWKQESGEITIPSSVKNFGKSAANVFKASLPAMLRIGSAGLISDETTGKLISTLTEETAHEALSQHKQARESIEAFKHNLQKIAQDMGKTAKSETASPLVVLVDEIDRCRPDFAVNYLECIKHFFNVPNVIFIIATDNEQLGHSLRTLYGIGMDVEGYLRRFIDLEFNLPKPDRKDFTYALIKKFELNERLANFRSQEEGLADERLKELLVFLAETTDMSLRDIEKAVSLIALVLLSTSENHFLYAPLIALLITLKIKKPELYTSYVSGARTAEQVIDQLWNEDKIQLKDEKDLRRIALIEVSLAVFSPLSRYKEQEVTKAYKEKCEQLKPKEEEKGSNQFIKADWAYRLLNDDIFDNAYGRLDVILKRIDLFAE